MPLEHVSPILYSLLSGSHSCAAVDACRWATCPIPNAPYVTSLPWISHYGAQYVVHGDDITSDADGNDCYRFVKEAGRFKIVKRTPGISTTDLVGRMLLCTKTHFIKNLDAVLEGQEGHGDEEERKKQGAEMKERIVEYASDASGKSSLVDVWAWHNSDTSDEQGSFAKKVQGQQPQLGQRVVYVDGGFDLFSSGHIEFLKRVVKREEVEAKERGWNKPYSPIYLVAGVHDDETINYWKGVNYPIMNIFERGLCVLQCKYISALVFSSPFTPSKTFLDSLPYKLDAVYHGPTMSFLPGTHDPYTDAKSMGLLREISAHNFSHVNATEIVDRILKSRAMYEERQRVKGVKGIGEEAVRRREEMEREQEARQSKIMKEN